MLLPSGARQRSRWRGTQPLVDACNVWARERDQWQFLLGDRWNQVADSGRFSSCSRFLHAEWVGSGRMHYTHLDERQSVPYRSCHWPIETCLGLEENRGYVAIVELPKQKGIGQPKHSLGNINRRPDHWQTNNNTKDRFIKWDEDSSSTRGTKMLA